MSADVDEPVAIADYDPRWPIWFHADAVEIERALGSRVRRVEHFGSTSVPGLAAKPIVDILVAPSVWPLDRRDREALESLGYEHLGEAGVPGRQYFRRRAEHNTNLAVVELGGPLWHDNILLRDFLRSHPDTARAYGRRKRQVWMNGARRLLAYSSEKAAEVTALLDAARRWRAG
jgi:GrpB-like predicted nucleotidyltransferase (UPF0157 family)